ncbi:GNAT family N-acetyltransferase [Duganella callida]|uniref:GNAT family N-acetyltransferase n=1 Tax=Duganella callida TaxID=2561932 RepID=A0A4Y9SQW8_9BURK|nr:GNAT family N-acetyltransferase [Duganella callida]TFW29060.1 GNAT family N-acetyltransferase [Duganella callida]
MAKKVVALDKTHNTKEFDCGNEELNHWFQTIAMQHQKNGTSKTFVHPDEKDDAKVAGFFSMAMRGLVPKEDLPEDMQKRLPRNIPGYTLARLAVAQGHQGLGLGAYLLLEAMERAQRAAENVGGFALFVDAKEGAASFYEKYGFRPLPSDPDTLVLPIAAMPQFPK